LDGLSGETFPGQADAASWRAFIVQFRQEAGPLPPPWGTVFAPLCQPGADGLTVVGQIGQTLDGRIATASGDSHYINGHAGLCHLHRLRALVDAVLVGVGTVIADDPQLTVRRVDGPDPARVVVDPNGRIPPAARLLNDDGARRIVLTTEAHQAASADKAEVIVVPTHAGTIAPADIRAALRGCGFRRVLVEGGADTLSRFLAAGCLDRLHVIVAPMVLGSGRPSITLPPVARVAEALPVAMRAIPLGDEVLLDCSLAGSPGHGKDIDVTDPE
jgi:riboflavin-specific deaminase-like protein